MTTIAIIPSRYGSTRFPGKPLALLCGKPVVQWVYEAASKVFDHVVVATDDARIQCAVAGFGGQAVITSQPHTCGTGRVAEAVEILRSQADIVVNIQGDEPLIQPEHLQALKQRIMLPDVQIATIAVPLAETVAYEEIADPNLVKVVLDDRHNALYFSRAVVPYVRGLSTADWPSANVYYAHAGVYAFKADTLAQISILPQSSLERAEKLEQLRWLQAGYSISCVTLDAPIVSIDTPDDLQKAESLLKLDKPDKNYPSHA